MRRLLLFWLTAGAALAQEPQVSAALSAGSYFPLEIGDRWVYRIDSRFGSAGYETRRVDRQEDRNGKTYMVISVGSLNGSTSELRFRADDQGRVFQLTDNGEQLYLDPRPATSEVGQLELGKRGPYTSAIGTFGDTVSYSRRPGSLELESGVLARGIGLVESSSTLQTGSSGGFLTGVKLVEAVIEGKLRFSLATSAIELGMETLSFDMTKVENCAVPCYFVACYLAPGADPPGTYKPCARARVNLSGWPPDAVRAVRLRLTDAAQNVIYEESVALPHEVAVLQIPLYTSPNQPLPPGVYRMSATTEDGLAQSSLTLRVQ